MLNSRVASVGRNCVTVVDSRKNETSDIPFGACVWATGVAMHPLVKQLQVSRSAARGAATILYALPTFEGRKTLLAYHAKHQWHTCCLTAAAVFSASLC